MHPIRFALATFFPIVLLVSCADSGRLSAPPGPGTDDDAPAPEFAARPNPSFLPFAFTISNCTELVDVSGTFHQTDQFFVGPGGKQHFRFHINAKGTGVGQQTGARYQWNDRLFDISNVAPVGTVSFTRNDNTRLIGQGGAVDARLAVQIKVTINSNGQVVVDRFRALDTCS
jgi:hypothetical protein